MTRLDEVVESIWRAYEDQGEDAALEVGRQALLQAFEKGWSDGQADLLRKQNRTGALEDLIALKAKMDNDRRMY